MYIVPCPFVHCTLSLCTLYLVPLYILRLSTKKSLMPNSQNGVLHSTASDDELAIADELSVGQGGRI